MRHFLHLAYAGQPFHGWQVQPGQTSVQGCLEEAFATLLRQPTPVTGAGRTDAGVNARSMIAHLDLPDHMDASGCRQLLRSANAIVGRDIALYSLTPVAADARARFDASEREYRYFVHTRKNPFCRQFSWQAPPALDFEAMNAAAEMLIGRRDFCSFAKTHSDVKTTVCDLRLARWVRDNEHCWHFEIAADRFLRNMVRAVVGTLVDVGRGRMAPETVLDILERHDRCAAGTSMPAEALFLWRVDYPYYHAEP